MEAIKDVIKDIMAGLAVRKKSHREDPDHWLRKILSRQELRHIKCKHYKNGTLSISVDSSSWLYHLTAQKERLLDALSKKDASIKNIRFSLGKTI